MYKIKQWWASVAEFFCWLAFIDTLFVVSEALRLAKILRLYDTRWLDVFASYATLGVVGLMIALAVAILLALLESLARPLGAQLSRRVPRGIIFSLFVAIWLHILRLVLIANNLILLPIPILWLLLGFFLAGSLVFCVRADSLMNWLDGATGRLRPIVLAAVSVMLGLTMYLLLEPRNHGLPAPVDIEPSPDLPDIIIVVLDSLTSRDMSLYGYHLPTTPNLEQLSRTWTVYENAHAAGAGTLAFLPTLLTGRYPYLDQWHLYGDLAHSRVGWMDLAQVLRTAGYETVHMTSVGYIPGTYHLHANWDRIGGGIIPSPLGPTVLSQFALTGIRNAYTWQQPVSALVCRPPLSDAQLYSQVQAYLRSRAQASIRKPLFACFHMIGPHDPYLAGEYMGAFLPLEEGLTDLQSQMEIMGEDIPRVYPPDRQPKIDNLRLRYDETILKTDAELAQFIATLQELGLYDRSLIVITADHGENFQSGCTGHYTSLLAATEHSIPLLVKYPWQTVGQREKALVSNIDIMPTVLDLIGASYPRDWLDGQPLRLAGQTGDRTIFVRRPHETAARDDFTSAAINGDLKLLSRDKQLFLYDLAADPDERVNLLGQRQIDDLRQALERFRLRMQFIRSGGDVRRAPPL